MRLIDADALMEDLDKGLWGKEWDKALTEAIINDAPTIDAVEVVRGEWKPFDRSWGRSIWYCTACKESVEVPCDIWTHKPIYDYCPNCGSDMREREGER